MALIHLENVSLSFGEAPLLDKINFQIDDKERLFLIGRNGMGKSCFFKLITGNLSPDQGQIHRQPGLKIAELAQDLSNINGELSVYDYVAEGLQEVGLLLAEYHLLTQETQHDAAWLRKIEEVQRKLEQKDGWEYIHFIESILTRLELPAEKKIKTLSGGWQRRAALARALVSKPHLLLLDEPTNHLDLYAIEWLEEYLAQYSGALLCITHDRIFLQKLSKRILELDRGQLTSWNGGYDKYLIGKEQALEIEARKNALFDKNLAKEEAWIRQGVKARRTRNEGRVRALEKLRDLRQKRIELQGKPKFSSNERELSGELVIDLENVNFKINDHILIQDLSLRIMRGDKIALIGSNGVGKSTLLKMMLGDLDPDSGKVSRGTNLQIAYFDQLRAGINPELTAIENVAGGRETIRINNNEKHIISYLGDFLFSPERVRIPVKLLSGGECNRLLLAKLFSLPSNLLVLDEPTNDLDMQSLELLEEILVEYQGTILLVSHDRAFVNAVATSVLYFSGNGKITEYVGGYDAIPSEIRAKNQMGSVKKSEEKVSTQKSGFNSKLKKELESLPEKISNLEKLQNDLQIKISDPTFYEGDKKIMADTLLQLKGIELELKNAYARWEELEKLKQDP